MIVEKYQSQNIKQKINTICIFHCQKGVCFEMFENNGTNQFLRLEEWVWPTQSTPSLVQTTVYRRVATEHRKYLLPLEAFSSVNFEAWSDVSYAKLHNASKRIHNSVSDLKQET